MKVRLAFLALASFLTLLFAPVSALAGAIQQTVMVTYSGGTLSGNVELYMSSPTGGPTLFGSTPFTVQAGQDVRVLSIVDDAGTAACWIALGGTLGDVPVFAYAANTDVTSLTQPLAAPIVNTAMTDGTSTVSTTGELVAFDSPEIIGSWTLTEAPAPVPEPSGLILVVSGLAAAARIIRGPK